MSDVEISHHVNKGEDAEHVSSVFQGVTFDKCYVQLDINSTILLDTISKIIFKDFHPVFHWVSKHMHVTWYTCSDL